MKTRLTDSYNRTHDYLRISLTDKCNFNCVYCNPLGVESEYLRKNSLLSFDEILRTIDLFAGQLGFTKFRFTGGEPLVRKGVLELFRNVNKLKSKYGFTTGLTTNASLLRGRVDELRSAGIDKLNISLDSLNRRNFGAITNRDSFNDTMTAVQEAIHSGYSDLKINCVVIKDKNDNELIDFTDFAVKNDINVRFIEFMPFGNNAWQKDGFISYQDMIKTISKQFHLIPHRAQAGMVSKDYKVEGQRGKISFITSISEHFCDSCNRVRLSADGNFRLCLFTDGNHELNIRDMIRQGLSNDELINSLNNIIKFKWEKHPSADELTKLEKNNMLKIGG